MNIKKEAETLGGAAEADLAAINRYSKKTLTAEEVYTFAVRLCDNEIDREGERFPTETLRELAPLFLGKTGLFDHQWSAKGQSARIYSTQVVEEQNAVTAAGDPLCYLKGFAYMLRTEGNAQLIAEIEGGIKKEVSVGCAVKSAVCSICHQEIATCEHEKGQLYGGAQCYAELRKATDAYEWSFVAVPAQRNAGVMKGMKQEELEREAALGRKYVANLRGEVARLMGLCEPALTPEVCKAVAEGLGPDDLGKLEKVYRLRATEALPAGAQLPYYGERVQESQDSAFLI
ncbi:MAG: hypothetical protein RSB55_00850 [Oscillospiraceae bacterium]